MKEKSYGPALEQIQEALKRSPRDADLNEQAGDVESALHHSAEAGAFYRVALENAGESKMRKRIRAKSMAKGGQA
jgi:predicted Zn-dependent protease